MHQGSKQNTVALFKDQTWKAHCQGQKGRSEKELERQTRVFGNSLLRGPLPKSGPKPRAATTSAPGQHPAIAQSHPAVRENCPPRVDNIWKEWIFGKSPSAGWVPTSPHLLRPPPTRSSPFSFSHSYKNATVFPSQPVASSVPAAAAQGRDTDPQDREDTMKSLLLLSVLAALAVAALCYGEKTCSLVCLFCPWLQLASMFPPPPPLLALFSIIILKYHWCNISQVSTPTSVSSNLSHILNIQTLVCNLSGTSVLGVSHCKPGNVAISERRYEISSPWLPIFKNVYLDFGNNLKILVESLTFIKSVWVWNVKYSPL